MQNMEKPAGKNEIYSVYAEKHKKEMARIEMLEAQIEALRKSAQAQGLSDRPELIARIQEEIKALENEIMIARRRAEDHDADERSINALFESSDADKMPQA